MPTLDLDASMVGQTLSATPGALTGLWFRSASPSPPPWSWFTLVDGGAPPCLSLYNLDFGSTPRSANGMLSFSLVGFPIPFSSLVLAKCPPGQRMTVEWQPSVSPPPPEPRAELREAPPAPKPEEPSPPRPSRPSARRPVHPPPRPT